MTTAILVAIAVMWIPVALLFLGYGEAKGTGAITGMVGLVTVLGAFLQTATFNDAFTGGLLFAHGLLYLTVSYALLTGLEDMRSVGNVSLTVAIISAVYAIVFLTGTELIPQSYYLGMAAVGYTVLTVEVWLNAYGKFSAKGLAASLIVWAVIGLWIPAFALMTTGTLPF
ncbi:MAG: AmiS/UreI family transporter [Bacillota bacterium]|nr:AmiS/UreI family transporter [Bacillota bacterium]MDW7682703.1 AmiS/UreI family transporter [Bacillota bacterium]